MIELNKIYNESCLDTMKRMEDNFVDLTVTSPPYDNLRDYTKESNWNFGIFSHIAHELFRITKLGGVVVWVVGDATIKGSETGSSFRQALYFKDQCGFSLHDTMIYEKNGPAFPANKKSARYSSIFEYMFVLSKGSPKTTNLIKDRKNRWAGATSFGRRSYYRKDGSKVKKDKIVVSEYGYRFNIWKYSTGKGYSTKDSVEHPAIFPEKLAKDHIISWSDPNDIIYDPFMGSGTTAKMAWLNQRQYIGSEIAKEYCKITERRIKRTKIKKFREDLENGSKTGKKKM